jgi:DNA-binding response OmpR family regulator
MDDAIRKRILIIEDDPDILFILNYIFLEEGYEVIISKTGAEADDLEVIRPDLILMDIRLEGAARNGDEICACLKSHPLNKHFPIILLSAEENLSFISHNCHADAYLQKPFDLDVLSLKVREHIL